MTAVLRALEARAAAGDPIRVALVGAGYAGRGFAARIIRRTPGIELVAIANRTVAEAERAYREAGVDAPGHVSSAAELDVAIRNHRPVDHRRSDRPDRRGRRRGDRRGDR